MTDEERFQRITERHEALAQTVELMLHSIEEERRNIQEQRRTAERILTIVEGQATHFEVLFKATTQLAETANSHERRLERLEGRT